MGRMTRGQRRTAEWGQAVEAIMGEGRELKLTPNPAPRGRGARSRTPHERARVARRVTVTLPSEEWVEAIREGAGRFGLRVSDYLCWCIAYALGAVESGEARPEGSVEERAGVADGVRLPWEP